MNKVFLLFAILLAVCALAINAAPAGSSQLLDANTIIERITAEYEKLGGSSYHHPPEVATLIDPNNFHLHF